MSTDGDATERQPTGQGAPLDPTADALPPDAASDRTSTAGPPDDPAPLPRERALDAAPQAHAQRDH
ncbi:MAG: phospholipid carrier-dependent glycosyltransferase, partial [Cellulomonas iranensis]|nr:phospholipid carrier-dependent glycosyltransferase [Cellulomonas iranensis]